MPQESLMRRRLVAVEKRIEDIQPESDVRVRLIGTVIDVAQNSIVIDDGSGKIDIFFEKDPMAFTASDPDVRLDGYNLLRQFMRIQRTTILVDVFSVGRRIQCVGIESKVIKNRGCDG